MSDETYTTTFFGDTYEIKANWPEPASPVWFRGEEEWVPLPQQVADFGCSPRAAMRHVLREIVEYSGDDPDDPEIRAAIEDAIEIMD